jgi:metal-responsive CopG/Arc/MetJ family transcriptional regulator
MKVKTSITLSEDLLRSIDKRLSDFKSRSEFLEIAAREHLARMEREKAARRDIEIINRHADELNAEAEDVLAYQKPL